LLGIIILTFTTHRYLQHLHIILQQLSNLSTFCMCKSHKACLAKVSDDDIPSWLWYPLPI